MRPFSLWMAAWVLAVGFLVGCGSDDSSDSGDLTGDGDQEIQAEQEETETAPRPEYALDDVLRINQIQVKGTHNSYHVFEGEPQPVFGGNLDPLDVQADEQGVRQFEIDVHYDPDEGFLVYHTEYGDTGSNCETLFDCLTLLKNWSDIHPGHHVLFVFIEPKDDNAPLQMVEHSDDLDALIESVWPPERLIRPDDVRGEFSTLREGIENNGWPTMGEGRDKALFIYFDSDEYRDAYLEDHPNAEGRTMFPRSDKKLDSPIGAFINCDDPTQDAEKIREFTDAGFLVRTRTDVAGSEPAAGDRSRIEAALASAAQMISTDYPVQIDLFEYSFDIPDGAPSRCHPFLAPEGCESTDVENLP